MGDFQEVNHWLFQLANVFLFLSYISTNILMLRSVLLGAGACFALWGYFILDISLDTVLWNGAFTIINASQIARLLFMMRPVEFDNDELELVYDKLFKHSMSRLDFKTLAGAGFLRQLNAGSSYCDEGSTAHYLSILISGQLGVSKRGTDLNTIEPVAFIDSPQWVSRFTSQGRSINVTIVALEDSCYLMWPRENLEQLMMNPDRPFRTALDAVVGVDISTKLQKMNEIAVRDDYHIPNHAFGLPVAGLRHMMFESPQAQAQAQQGSGSSLELGHRPSHNPLRVAIDVGGSAGADAAGSPPVLNRVHSHPVRGRIGHGGASLHLRNNTQKRGSRRILSERASNAQSSQPHLALHRSLRETTQNVVERLRTTLNGVVMTPASQGQGRGSPSDGDLSDGDDAKGANTRSHAAVSLSTLAQHGSAANLPLPSPHQSLVLHEQLRQLEALPGALLELYVDVVNEVRVLQEVLQRELGVQIHAVQDRVAATLDSVSLVMSGGSSGRRSPEMVLPQLLEQPEEPAAAPKTSTPTVTQATVVRQAKSAQPVATEAGIPVGRVAAANVTHDSRADALVGPQEEVGTTPAISTAAAMTRTKSHTRRVRPLGSARIISDTTQPQIRQSHSQAAAPSSAPR